MSALRGARLFVEAQEGPAGVTRNIGEGGSSPASSRSTICRVIPAEVSGRRTFSDSL